MFVMRKVSRVALVFAMITLAPIAATAQVGGPPQVGFEIELGNEALRANWSTSGHGNPHETLLVFPAVEKTPNSMVARSVGSIPDAATVPAPRLFEITIDNAQVEQTNARAVRYPGQLGNRKPINLSGSRGRIEVVTGPLVYNDDLTRDVFDALNVLWEALWFSCATRIRDTNDTREEYLVWSAIEDEYNQRLQAMQHAPRIPNIRGLLRLETATPENTVEMTEATDIYVRCEPRGTIEGEQTTNANRQTIVDRTILDFQNTFGVPLAAIGAGDFVIDWGTTVWERNEDDWPNAIDNLKWQVAGVADPPTPVQLAEIELLKNSLKGLVQVWAGLVFCSIQPRQKGQEWTTSPIVLCNKNFLKPLPHVDVCALANSVWIPGQESVETRQQQFRAALKLDKILKEYLTGKANAGWKSRYFNENPDATAAKMGDSLFGDCAFWHENRMQYADATIIPPLNLRVRMNGVAVVRTGFALETRGRGKLPSIEIIQNNTVLEIVHQLSRAIHPILRNCNLLVKQGDDTSELPRWNCNDS